MLEDNELEFPTATLPKPSVVGVAVRRPRGTAVPDRGRPSDWLEALEVIDTRPVMAPP